MKHYTLHFFLSVALFAAAFSPLAAQRSARQALKAYELGNFAEAAEAYEKIVRKSTSPDDLSRYAESLRMLGRLDEAAAAYEKIGNVESPEIAYRHALSLVELGRYPQAVERLSMAASMQHPAAAPLARRLAYAQAHSGEPGTWKVSNEFVNSTGNDYGAELVGEMVVFASARDGGKVELYRSVRDDNNFLRVPSKLHKVGGEPNAEAPLAYTPSGQLIAYTRNNFQAGERFLPEAGWELSLMLTTPTEDNDFLPGKAFPHNGTGYSTGFPSFSEDGTRIYFASNRPGGEGGYDLYYCDRQNDSWSTPINLGPAVNTPGNEISPSASNGALFFASDCLPGFGGMDIYRADMLGVVLTNVVNLGEGVNSTLDEMGFTVTDNGEIGYFASNRAGGKGGMDLYRAVRSGTAVTFAVIDGKTRKPVPNAVLDFGDCGQGVFLTGVDGAYTFRALPTLNCRPYVRKSGFNAKQFSFVAKGMTDQQRVEIVLNPEDKITVYEGKVVSSRTGDAIPGAKVFARHKASEFTADATADKDGRYELGLERSGEYIVEYQATGFARIDRELSTFDSDGASALSTFAMFPAAGSSSSAPNNYTSGVDPDSVPSEANTGGRSGGSIVAAPSAGAKVQTRRVAGSVEQGYAVQVAATKTSIGNIADYQRRFASYGQVYGRVEGDMMRVRVGPFSSREEAQQTLNRIKSGAKADAFIATESGGTVVGLDREEAIVSRPNVSSNPAPITSSKSTSSASPTTSSSSGNNSPSTTSIDAGVRSASKFMIRLATYSSLANFDQAKASALGNLTTRRSGEYVIVLLQGYESASSAQSRVSSVRQGGFPDAHVVEEQADGTLKMVR